MAHSLTAVTAFPLRRLLALARDLMQAADLKSVLELVGTALQELVTADDALLVVNLGDHEYGTAFDPKGCLRPLDRNGLLHKCARQALTDATPVILPAAAMAPTEQAPEQETATASLLAVPFPPIEPIGALAVLWHRGHSDLLPDYAVILRYISELAGAAVGNLDFKMSLEEQVSARTEEIEEATREHAHDLRRHEESEQEIHRISMIDVLTGMLNRRGFLLHAEQAFKAAQRQNAACAVISVDIDGLKPTNEELGYEIGDLLIQACARILRDSLRDSDIIARLGGGRFAAFALSPGAQDAIQNRIRDNTETFRRRATTPYRVSFSTGIVRCDPASGASLAEYVARAEQQMQEQKKKRSMN